MSRDPLSSLLRGHEAEVARQRAENSKRAIEDLQHCLETEGPSSATYLELYRHRLRLHQVADGIAALKQGCDRCLPDEDLYRTLVFALAEANRTGESISVADFAQKLFPHTRYFEFTGALQLPVLYEEEEDIGRYRERFTAGQKTLIRNTCLDNPESRRSTLAAVSQYVTFYLGYQGRNDLELQKEYGRFLHKVMAAIYPEWVRPLEMPPVTPGRKIRIGYISAHFRRHSISKLFTGWLSQRNREEFEIFVYHNGGTVDPVTDKIRQLSDHFVHLPGEFEALCRAVLADRLHIAVYLDVRHRRMAMMSALRLAPIQCLAWGFPITSGSPMIDYFLSGERMEPENGEAHYSERLVRLPGIGVYYPKPVVPRPILVKKRSDFGLGEDRTVYLCCQSLFKYLPQHDHVFADIAKRDPTAQFVFLASHDAIGEIFMNRLERAFAAQSMNAGDYCVVRPAVSIHDYLNLNILSDVFLDSMEWSGGVTALEAIACGLPIVTLPGPYMRGRHSYGILTQLGVTETIARDKADYVDIAVRLGRDRAWRSQVLERMAAGHERLYWDMDAVRGLEDFFRQGVSAARYAG